MCHEQGATWLTYLQGEVTHRVEPYQLAHRDELGQEAGAILRLGAAIVAALETHGIVE